MGGLKREARLREDVPAIHDLGRRPRGRLYVFTISTSTLNLLRRFGMGEGYNFKALKREILSRSHATDWLIARREWALVDVYEADENETCLCEHYPIREICVISNKTTNKATEVGNVCVKRFLGIRSDLIFKSLKRIRKDPAKTLNEDAIAFFFDRRLLNQKEFDFLQDTWRKRKLTFAQLNWRSDINRKVLDAVKRRGLQVLKNDES